MKDEEVEGVLTYPEHYETGKRYPLITENSQRASSPFPARKSGDFRMYNSGSSIGVFPK